MAKLPAFKLSKNPVHLGLGAKVIEQPKFTGMPWYEAYGARHAADGFEGRLVSMHTFGTWDSWEMHPNGEELVVCVAGRIVLTQQVDGVERKVKLKEGEAVINPRGVWHTAAGAGEATALFITAGAGTEGRPREGQKAKKKSRKSSGSAK
ncbi:MAG: cupin domain-containing protein [Polyangiaceae bacterium]|nr:cupin domain-containing protein [Polyangiaceae bacterium]